MSRPDLFSSNSDDDASNNAVLSVTQITRGLGAVVEDAYGDVWVEGELSNFTRARSGHCYFTLKDDDAQISCVLWRYNTRHIRFEPDDGQQVVVHGSAGVYQRRGDLQIICDRMRRAGQGAQQQAFERLKRKLQKEGLFDTGRKRPLPTFPTAVGLITSGSGAAQHDVLTVLARRFPAARVVHCPVPVQGMEAPGKIARAIERFNELANDDPRRPDVLIVGRGGGSTEDLWAFNEEVVARAIAASTIPIVSAVGHESDVSIADFTADRRAATPSMAAEIVVPDRTELAQNVRSLHRRLRQLVERQIQDGRQHVDRLTNSRAFHSPLQRLQDGRQRLADLERRLHAAAGRTLERANARLDRLTGRLKAVDPKQPLRRGYAFVAHDGAPVAKAADLATGDVVTLHFEDGEREAEVLKTGNGE